jgi:hypothetical protein
VTGYLIIALGVTSLTNLISVIDDWEPIAG